MSKYDDEAHCYKCGGQNEVKTTARDSYHTCECTTKCKVCGFEAYWAYGFYQIEPDDEKPRRVI